MTGRLEASRIRNEGLYRPCGDRTDARDSGEAAHILVLLRNGHDLARKLFDPRGQTIDLIDNLLKSEAGSGRQAFVTSSRTIAASGFTLAIPTVAMMPNSPI